MSYERLGTGLGHLKRRPAPHAGGTGWVGADGGRRLAALLLGEVTRMEANKAGVDELSPPCRMSWIKKKSPYEIPRILIAAPCLAEYESSPSSKGFPRSQDPIRAILILH